MERLYDWKSGIKKDELEETIKVLKNDGLVLVPTETVYGIGANAFSDIACKKIYEAKHRAQDNPLIVHVSDYEMLKRVANVSNEIEQKLIEAFMPGPFTLILEKRKEICDTASAGLSTIGVRMPSNSIIHEIIKESQIPIAAPSANVSGRPSGTNVADIMKELEDKMDVMIDGGDCPIGIESTVVKVIDGIPTILRPGFVTEDDIQDAIGCVKLSNQLFKTVSKDEKVESPGMKYRHYAPKTKCVLVLAGDDQIDKVNALLLENQGACVLGFEEDRDKINITSDRYIEIGSKQNLITVSQHLFSSLRKIDEIDNCPLAIVEGVEKKDLGLSIMNRLIRACEHNTI